MEERCQEKSFYENYFFNKKKSEENFFTLPFKLTNSLKIDWSRIKILKKKRGIEPLQ
ncbi:hypothetical protein HMPREF1150_1501 [Streptococcus sp. AS14]|nr:hypothetical protein HMPREF1150_1501 [Streptococcus sp. AS14]